MKKETKLYPYEKRLTRKGERMTGVDAHKKCTRSLTTSGTHKNAMKKRMSK